MKTIARTLTHFLPGRSVRPHQARALFKSLALCIVIVIGFGFAELIFRFMVAS